MISQPQLMQQVKIKDREKIEIYFSARGLVDLDVLSKSDPQCYVYLKEGAQGVEKLIGKTEVRKNNLNPDWKTSVVLDFIFEVNQYLRCVVIDSDEGDFDDNDTIGSLQTTVGQVMGSRNQIYIGELKHQDKARGKLLIKADVRKDIGGNNELIYWQWYGQKIKNMDGWFGTSDPFLRFYKWHMKSDWLLVHETEFKQDNSNPVWRGFDIEQDRLHDDNPQQPIKIELWDNEKNGKHQLIGAIEVTIEQIIFQEKRSFEVKTPQGELGGILGIKTMMKPSFIDYLKGGEQINLSIAIDFTGSNGNPKYNNSLHFNCPGQLNQYQNALSQVSEILLNYDFDKKVPVYGFGGIPHLPNYKKSESDHCFPLNGKKDDPEVFQLDGIMKIYSFALQHIDLGSPTNFGSVIENAMKQADKNKKKDIYNVLLILTDGQITDMDETKNLIKKCTHLPISIIIVGVGTADFRAMKNLDDDQDQTRDEKRDLVQFVPFQQCSQLPGGLARELLAELPNQLVEYKLLVGREPQQSQNVDISKLFI